MATSSLNLIASTFIILYVIDLVDFAGLSIVISISFVVSALTDYPTGVLADWLGHKWVLAVGYGFYAIASILLVFAPAASNPLRYLGFTYVVLALASGQASGALESWFDNSYKDATTLEDPKKEIYREYLGKATMLIQYSGSLAFLFGGILASLLGDSGRQIVFFVQGIGLIGVTVAFILFLDSKEVEEEAEKEEKSYIQLMKEGLAFSFSSRMMVLLVSSSVLIMAAYKVWISLILFVIYFQYAGTDASAGILRWLVWFSFATLAAYAGKLSKKLTVKPWIPRLSLAFSLFYYIVPAVLLFFIPLPNPAEFTLAGSIMIYLLMVIGMFFVATRANLEKKLQLEIIPDDLRNSYYSLIPSLSLLISAFFITIIGSIVTNSGIISGLLAVGAISFVAVFLEFLAIQLYEPSEDIEEEDENPLYNIYSIEVYDSLEYRIPTKWKFAKDVELIWDQLLEIAYQDDKVSKDEMDLLDHIMIHLKDYGEILERAREDDIITEEEKLELVLARAKLLQKVEEKAKDDSVITEEEEKILDKLKFIIHQLQEEQES